MLSSDWRRCARARRNAGASSRDAASGCSTGPRARIAVHAASRDGDTRVDRRPQRAGDDARRGRRRRAREPPTTRPSLRLPPPRAAPGDDHALRRARRPRADPRALRRGPRGQAHHDARERGADARRGGRGGGGASGRQARDSITLGPRLLDPAVRLAVTNNGVGAPTPWAAPCDEEAFPRSRRFSVPNRGGPSTTAPSRCSTTGCPAGDSDGHGREDDERPTVLTFERGARSPVVSRRGRRRRAGNDASPARESASSDGESAGPRPSRASSASEVDSAGSRAARPRGGRGEVGRDHSGTPPPTSGHGGELAAGRGGRGGCGGAGGGGGGGGRGGGLSGRARLRRCSIYAVTGRGRRPACRGERRGVSERRWERVYGARRVRRVSC